MPGGQNRAKPGNTGQNGTKLAVSGILVGLTFNRVITCGSTVLGAILSTILCRDAIGTSVLHLTICKRRKTNP